MPILMPGLHSPRKESKKVEIFNIRQFLFLKFEFICVTIKFMLGKNKTAKITHEQVPILVI